MRAPYLLLFIPLALVADGCARDACSVDPRMPDNPVPAIECESGDLCYRGRCVSACTAGREEVEECSGNGDCSAARPRCINGFCSACDPGERCIPVLDICEVVNDVPLPDVPEIPMEGSPRPPRPRDAGTLDGGLVRPGEETPDAGQVDLPLTRTVMIDVARTELRIGTASVTDTVEVRAFDVTMNPAGLNWRPDLDPPAIEETIEADSDCDLNALLAPPRPPQPADFGTIRIDDFNDSGALARELVAEWDVGRSAYVVSPSPLAQPTVTLSDFSTLDSTFITVTGSRVSNVTASSWPARERGLHVPFDLRLEAPTELLLSAPVALAPRPDPITRDITILFQRVGTGVVATEQIVVRVPGARSEILCQQPEGPNVDNRVVLRAGLLERFRDREEARPGATYPLIVERASAERLSVEPDSSQPDFRFFVVTRARHSLVGRLVF